MTTCDQCGVVYADSADSCTARWHALLALDHSRQAPWGPRHGVAFATWTLQHSLEAEPGSLERSWLVLHRLLVAGDDIASLFPALRTAPPRDPAEWGVPPLPRVRPARFAVTIRDLGDFDAATYVEDLSRWAGATLEAWQQAGRA